MMITSTRWKCAFALAAVLPHIEPVFAGMPTDQVRLTVDQVMTILKDPNLNTKAAAEQRRAALREAIFPRFDFAEMAKRSLGSEWRRRTSSEQNEFVRLFTDLVKDSYVSSIESYKGDQVNYRRESQDGDFAEVGTVVVTQRGEQFVLDYRLNRAGREWKVYDVIIENVSIVNNFRSQFRRVIAREGFAELIRRLRDKAEI